MYGSTMSNLTRNVSNKSQIKKDGSLVLQSANSEGEAILEEIIKFSKDKKYIIPEKLSYVKDSKCWLNKKGKIVLFNIAEKPADGINLVKDFLSGKTPTAEKVETVSEGQDLESKKELEVVK